MIESSDWVNAVLKHRQPLEPLETDVVAELQSLPSVRAVVFDIYGTLVISGSGDVGSADTAGEDSNIGQAMAAVGIVPQADRIPTVAELHEQIKRLNDSRRDESCPKPEVDVVEAWRKTLESRKTEFRGNATKCVVQLAAEYEARANPTWPMPGATELLSRLKEAGIPLGIVSNAQVFTPFLVENLLAEESLQRGGFDSDLCIFSNRFRQAKPGPRLFDVLREGLARRGIPPHEAIYVGNDMLNDVWAASQAGMKTAWFAGDARSCRRREDDPRCRCLRPDVVLTSLMQLLQCLTIE
jgi:putative hydrolase of the HAD superfamily